MLISLCFYYHLLPLVLAVVLFSATTRDNGVSCFSSFGNTHKSAAVIPVSSSSSSQLDAAGTMASSSSSVPTLTEETTWNLRMSLRDLPTKNGNKFPTTKDGIIFSIQAKFVEEINYEPPQGNLVQVLAATVTASIDEKTETTRDDNDESSSSSSSSMQMRLISGSWKLSEDPEDQKDGLWIWGLFKEPRYPYLLLQMEIDSIVLPGTNNDDEILPFQLYAQIDHKRGGENNGAVILSQVSTINVRSKETMKADPFGAATLDYYEDTPAGQLQLQPL